MKGNGHVVVPNARQFNIFFNDMLYGPLAFCLIFRQKRRDYAAVLQALAEVLPREPSVVEVVADFEKAMWTATREVFPSAVMKGCAFHWGQAVWRKVRDL